MGKWDVNIFLLKFDKQRKISTFLKSLFQTMFLSRQPNLAENLDPADSPEACGERQSRKTGAGKGRCVVTNPKPTASNAATFIWGKDKALPREFSTMCALHGAGFGCSQLRKEARQQSVCPVVRKTQAPSGLESPRASRFTVPKALHGTNKLGKSGTNRSIKNRLSGLPGKARVSALLPSPHIFH